MAEKNNLRLFCEYLIQKYASPEAISAEALADEFRNMFLDKLEVSPRALEAVTTCCGIKTEARPMPEGLRGYNDTFAGHMNIYYMDNDCRSGKENTILHEFRELMEHVLTELCPGYQPLRTSVVHKAADRFAAAVLLPRQEFKQRVYETGLDVVALSKLYEKSCSQVIIRIAEVLQGEMFYYGALYELRADLPRQHVLTYWSACSQEEELSLPAYLFPRKGRGIAPNSLVEEAIRQEMPCLVRRIIISELEGDNDLIALAQPVLVDDMVSKVALVVVLYQDRNVLRPQIERLSPVVIPCYFQHL